MGGTRYNARGIDDDGNVANHTEIESIFSFQINHDPPLMFRSSCDENA